MALTLNQEAFGRVSEVVVLPPRLGRNELCRCGSGAKYRRCCREQDEVLRREQRAAALPEWIKNSRGKLHEFEKYASNVFDLPGLLASLRDQRRDPDIPTFDVANSLLHTALLRIPSLNGLEGDLKKSDFQMLIGRKPTPEEKAFSAEVVSNVLDKFELDSIRNAIEDVIHKAERNKAFRDGYGPLRCVAVDGWEPFSSYQRHCPHCLVRRVDVKQADGEVRKVEQYYHRYVVALLLGPVLDVVLGIEPVLNEEALRDSDPHHEGHEGELTAGRRLIQGLHQSYGKFIDAIVADALYAVGPVMTEVTNFGYTAFLVLKNENHEPFKEALKLWEMEGPCESWEDQDRQEQVQFWDVDNIETLDSYQGKVRVIRALVTKSDQEKPKTWCFAVVGGARQVSRSLALRIIRARWHIENTCFHQWTKYWHLSHIFRHTARALTAVLLLWTLAFNLLQLFIYRRLGRSRRPDDPTDTIRLLVEVMLREMATLPAPIPWAVLLLNTS
jgi:hypothetical protein